MGTGKEYLCTSSFCQHLSPAASRRMRKKRRRGSLCAPRVDARVGDNLVDVPERRKDTISVRREEESGKGAYLGGLPAL